MELIIAGKQPAESTQQVVGLQFHALLQARTGGGQRLLCGRGHDLERLVVAETLLVDEELQLGQQGASRQPTGLLDGDVGIAVAEVGLFQVGAQLVDGLEALGGGLRRLDGGGLAQFLKGDGDLGRQKEDGHLGPPGMRLG